MSFRPSVQIQTALRKRSGYSVHRIEDGAGPMNLDNYRVEISQMPKLGSRVMTTVEVFSYFRKNINLFMQSGTCLFEPDSGGDAGLWKSDNPAGAVIHIDMYAKNLNIDDGSVVCAEAGNNYWIFATVFAPGDFSHPVSGNREFGFDEDGGKAVFYTMACDRLSSGLLAGAMEGPVFAGGHRTWLGFQRRLIQFVEQKGGKAKVITTSSIRVPWAEARKQHFGPRTPWLAPEPPNRLRPLDWRCERRHTRHSTLPSRSTSDARASLAAVAPG
jgi:hypothetical protein